MMLGPNITGSFLPEYRNNVTPGAGVWHYTKDTVGSLNGGVQGAFSFNDGSTVITDTGATTGFTFNATNSNAIYKDINTVQPISNQVLIIIKT